MRHRGGGGAPAPSQSDRQQAGRQAGRQAATGRVSHQRRRRPTHPPPCTPLRDRGAGSGSHRDAIRFVVVRACGRPLLADGPTVPRRAARRVPSGCPSPSPARDSESDASAGCRPEGRAGRGAERSRARGLRRARARRPRRDPGRPGPWPRGFARAPPRSESIRVGPGTPAPWRAAAWLGERLVSEPLFPPAPPRTAPPVPGPVSPAGQSGPGLCSGGSRPTRAT